MICVEYTSDSTTWTAIDWVYKELYDANDRSYEIISADIPKEATKVRVGLTFSTKMAGPTTPGELVNETNKLPNWLLPWCGIVNVTIDGEVKDSSNSSSSSSSISESSSSSSSISESSSSESISMSSSESSSASEDNQESPATGEFGSIALFLAIMGVSAAVVIKARTK